LLQYIKTDKLAKDVVYREANKDKIRERKRIYRSKNQEKISKRTRIYRDAHKEEMRAYASAYRKDNKDAINALHATWWILKLGTMIGITIAQKAEIAAIYKRALEAPKIRCYLCGEIIPLGKRHVDHIYPLSKGGKHIPSNLAIACQTCNISKSAKLPREIGLLC